MKLLALAGILALASAAPAQKWFDAPLILSPLDELRVGGDLDGDGDVDLLQFYGATSSGIWISFQVRWNDGAGGFTLGPTTTLPPTNQLPAILRPKLGDVTGDGLLDLVVTAFVNPTTGPGIRVYPGLAGGSFAASVFSPLPGNPRDLVLRDRDGNGALDIGVVHFSGGLDPAARWISWSGTGLVASPQVLMPGFSAVSIASADVTGDGVPDLLVGEWFGPNVRVIPTVGGNPTLGPLVSIPGAVGEGRNLLAGDLEGDGDEDVLVWTEDYTTGLWLVVVENLGGGVLNVGPTQFFSQALVPLFFSSAADLGDWDGDGDLDLIRQSEILSFFSNDGSNAFTFQAAVPTEAEGTGAGPADFDGDGVLDFCAAHVLKFGNGTFHSVLFPPVGSYGPTAAKTIDWEGDGDVDFLDTFGEVLVNDGTGSFSLTPSLWPAPPPSNIYRDPVALADFDGDGRADYLVARFLVILFPPMTPAVYQDMRLLRDDGVGGYVDAGVASAGPQIPPEFQGQMRRPAVDIDADGDLDLLDGGSYRANNGSGFFSPPVSLYAASAVDAGDVDADGDIDVLTNLGVSTTNSLIVQLNQGGLVFTSQTLFTSTSQDNRGRLLDLEGDGDLDAAVGAGPSGSQLRLFENVGGTFLLPPVSLAAAPYTTQMIGTGDVDGDGLLDVVTGPFDVNPNGSWINAYRRTGPGLVYQPRREYKSRLVRDFPDLDGDGDTDVSGAALLFGWNFEGLAAGRLRQYGLGTVGTGGGRPVLGGTGPVRPGSTTASVRLRRGLGGTAALLAVGTAEAALPDVPIPGMTAYLSGIQAVVPFVTLGAPGLAGDGRIDIPVPVPVLATITNTSLYLQVFLIDPAAPNFLTATNGLEFHVGA